jgi:carbohydrate-binding DOMON domain-containing protein
VKTVSCNGCCQINACGELQDCCSIFLMLHFSVCPASSTVAITCTHTNTRTHTHTHTHTHTCESSAPLRPPPPTPSF